MKFKTLAMSAAIAGTVAMGATAAATPANALSLDGGLQFSSKKAIASKVNSSTVKLELSKSGPFTVSNQTGDFTSVVGSPVFKNLPLALTSGTLANGGSFSLLGSKITSFISGLSIGSNAVTFDLTSANFSGFFKGAKNFNLGGTFDGNFISNGVTIGTGSLSTLNIGGSVGTSGQVATVAVPTPALLPGLLGFGVAALRKRKGEASTEVESEAVEVKA